MTGTCALMIPTCNRPNFLQRAMKYYGNIESEFPIVIGDSSDELNSAINRKAVEDAKADGIKIEYIKFSPDTELIEKLSQLIDGVDAEFIKFTADDDFTSVEFMKAATGILGRDSECSAVFGSEVRFKVAGDACFGNLDSQKCISMPPVMGRTASHRILTQSCQQMFTPVYNMKRRSLWQKIAARFVEIAAVDGKAENQAMFIDLIESISTLVAGNLEVVPDVMIGRQMHASAATITLRHRQDELARMVTPEWQKLIASFVHIMADELKSHQDLSNDEACQLVEFCYWSYVSRSLRGWVGRRGLKLCDLHSFQGFRLSSRTKEYSQWFLQKFDPFIEPIRYYPARKQFAAMRAVIEQS